MIETEPPVFFVDVEVEGRLARIALTAEELFDNRKYRLKVFGKVQYMLQGIKATAWAEEINDMMENVKIIPVSEEQTPLGQAKELFEEFIADRILRSGDSTWDTMAQGYVHLTSKHYCFRMRDFHRYLKDKDFKLLKHHEITTIVSISYKSEDDRVKTKQGYVRYTKIPKDSVEVYDFDAIDGQEFEEDNTF